MKLRLAVWTRLNPPKARSTSSECLTRPRSRPIWNQCRRALWPAQDHGLIAVAPSCTTRLPCSRTISIPRTRRRMRLMIKTVGVPRLPCLFSPLSTVRIKQKIIGCLPRLVAEFSTLCSVAPCEECISTSLGLQTLRCCFPGAPAAPSLAELRSQRSRSGCVAVTPYETFSRPCTHEIDRNHERSPLLSAEKALSIFASIYRFISRPTQHLLPHPSSRPPPIRAVARIIVY